ncbi:Stk1 family PASTA domain-containing Ser/Thr kinase [Tersicoccus phoenicis]|uniref:Stk1 family PASTA domain-containing Ser/Thr kinase n=1 Tax=Tersicoccus phoenicis TaxID=554083 RepID=UPI00117DE4E3|nr:Stk1 family PASTA domain-containing Ser/Thr kinase [Tersicoccus phoenicis]
MSEARLLSDRYRVDGLIGRGGMADVHAGHDTRLGRPVAIKLLRSDLARDPSFQSRFRREAQAVAALNHPNIVGIFDTGEERLVDAAGRTVSAPFIVMEYVTGHTVRQLITDQRLTIDIALRHADGVLAALQYSHDVGIVHRDIKPANVMVTDEGTVKVMDFGIARALEDTSATLTQTQAVLGTAAYLSPEQARGERVDARSDLYSAACLVYEMLTGRPPFQGDSAVSVAYQHVRELPPAASTVNPDVSPALDAVLGRALQKDRRDRFQDAGAFREALRATAGHDLGAGAGSGSHADSFATELLPRGTRRLAAAPTAGPNEAPATAALPRTAVPTPGATATPEPLVFGVGTNDDVHPETRARRRAWLITGIVALVLVLGAVAVYFTNILAARPAPPTTVAVPAVANLSQADASTALANADLRIRPERANSTTVKDGYAIRTEPGTGARVNPGTPVVLVISSGPASVALPENLAGRSADQVRDQLRQLGLDPVQTVFKNSATVSGGALIDTVPSLGKKVPAGSRVDLVVSTGKVTMPQLVGLTEAQAREQLAAADVALPVTVKAADNSVVKPGTVTGQSAPANGNVDQGSTVTITVARAPAQPTPSPSPSASGPGSGPSPTSSPSPSPTASSPSPSPTSSPRPSPTASSPSSPRR